MNNNDYKGIKILDSNKKHAIWCIDEELDNYYKVSLLSDRSRITTINKKGLYIISSDADYLYSDRVIDISFTLPFAFANFKTITVE